MDKPSRQERDALNLDFILLKHHGCLLFIALAGRCTGGCLLA